MSAILLSSLYHPSFLLCFLKIFSFHYIKKVKKKNIFTSALVCLATHFLLEIFLNYATVY